ncbi:Detected protein of unknown function [Hibiscus syriacus]|uniref:Pentatricopeptide repeat-containing protein n=1 Tax=Hibiscus syriacus TaxID=106335 RepID=A0A6A2Y9U4_HIBSY|nr:Detected protein of unknown function [Hibiscus syriacus]
MPDNYTMAIKAGAELFKEMINKGCYHNAVIVVNALQVCAGRIHELVTKRAFDLEISVSIAPIDLHVKCLSPDEAVNIFSKVLGVDVVAWVALFSGYTLNGMAYKSVGIIRDMMSSGIQHNAVMGPLIRLYSKCGSLDYAIEVSEGITDNYVVLWSAMIFGFRIHGRVEELLKLFYRMFKSSTAKLNNVTFVSILSTCSHAGLLFEGMEILHMMIIGK